MMVLDSLQISGQHILHLFSLFSIACVGRGASTVRTPSCSIHNNNGSEKTQEIHGSLFTLDSEDLMSSGLVPVGRRNSLLYSL